MKVDNTSLSRAYDEWKAAFMFDEKVYKIMLFILEKEDPRLLINRNPTLNYYSMLLMKIRTVKKDVTDYTMSIPLSILPGLEILLRPYIEIYSKKSLLIAGTSH